jgi:hypothetical protein
MITDAELDRLVDRAVWRRLITDRAYNHAETAEEQAEREQQITDEEFQRLAGKYRPDLLPDS